MFKKQLRAVIFALVAFSLVAVATIGVALAHGGREVAGKYEFTVGFFVEPAYEGIKTGLDLRVTKPAEEEAMMDHEHMDMDEGMDIDLETHGAVFSGTLESGETFSFEFTEDFHGLTVPYHSHNSGQGGTVMVMDSATNSGTVSVEIHDGMFEPSSVMVQPGTTVMWTNMDDHQQTVTSGPHSSFTGEETSHDEHATTVPVEGLNETLEVEVTHVPSGTSRVFPIRGLFNDPGHYTADFIPTASGQYSFRIFGTIEGVAINETFTSEVDGFNSMQSSGDIQFPNQLPELRELEAAAQGALSTAQQAEIKAADSGGSGLAVTGIALGAVGIVSGLGGLAFAFMKKPG
ncbi:MAG: hypothetical protein O2854_05355 [Chloroflexi bacterium]|nr:hypothetical protein [Chloroflexota bacterium]